MPILRPCFNWPLCDSKAYARHASDTTRLCRACWNVAPKRYGKVYLESSETPMPNGPYIQYGRSKTTRAAAKPEFKHPSNSDTPVKPNLDREAAQWLDDFAEAFDKEKERQHQIDAYWEKHPDMTRKQVEKKVRHGLPAPD